MSGNSIVYPLSMGAKPESIGNLTDLTTTNKTNVVSAVNEVNGKFPVSIANGGTGASTAEGALVNLNLIDNTEQDFTANTYNDYLIAVQNYFENNNTTYIPYVFNAGWANNGFGVGAGVKSINDGSEFLAILNQVGGLKVFVKPAGVGATWNDYSPNGILLYDNNSGTQSTITLYDSAQHYKYFEIYYKNDAGLYSSVKVHEPQGKAVQLSMLGYFDNQMYFRASYIEINGTSITFGNNGSGWGTSSSQRTAIYDGQNLLYVTRVVAYR